MTRLEPELFRVYAHVGRTIEAERLLDWGQRVLVAVSGGRDSMVLLDILALYAPERSLELGVFHFDHQLRPESGDDARFVAELAEVYGLPFVSRTADVAALTRQLGLSPEEGARHARYAGMREAAEQFGADRVALGHTADDRVETFLARLLAGAGSGGLASIRARRDIYIRPLLAVWHHELEQWKRRLPRQHLTDPTNHDTSIPRNRVRHVLLPFLEREFNPAVRETLLRDADLLAEESSLLQDLTEPLAACLLSKDGEEAVLDADAMADLTRAEQRLLLRRAIIEGGSEPTFRVVEDLISKVLGGASGSGLDLPLNSRAERVYSELRIGPRPRRDAAGVSPAEESLIIGAPGAYSALGLKLVIREATAELQAGVRPPDDAWRAWLDTDRLSFPLALRRPLPGDRFHPLGAGGSQKLQDFLVNAKAPRTKRRASVVLCSAGEIAWLVGRRIDDRFKVTPETRRVMEFVVEPI
ncbi:MAG: tRNA lysidine(34) synthetase TilS [Candidatus Geothermincolia bacterium]